MIKKMVSIATALALSFSPVAGTAVTCLRTIEAAAVPVRQADVSAPSEGNTLVPIRGSFYIKAPAEILNRINAIRKEACEEGLINPSTGNKLTPSDYKPIRWSSALEKIAQMRAAEAAVCQSHTRPNGQICFSCVYDGEQTWAEDLAWNWSGIMEGIEQWYEEKGDWVKQNSSAVTGHYTSMINPDYNYTALGCFRLESGGWYAVSGEFSFKTGLDESAVGVSGLYDQMIEVPAGSAADYAQYAGSTSSGGKDTSSGSKDTSSGGKDTSSGDKNTSSGGKDTSTTGKSGTGKSETKKANPLTLTVSSKIFRQAKLKKAKSFSIGPKNAQGKVTYTPNAAAKKAKIKVSKSGKITIPKKCRKGTYRITVTAAGNSSYESVSKAVVIKVK